MLLIIQVCFVFFAVLRRRLKIQQVSTTAISSSGKRTMRINSSVAVMHPARMPANMNMAAKICSICFMLASSKVALFSERCTAATPNDDVVQRSYPYQIQRVSERAGQ